MFAIAIWDERAARLMLARDRAGKKPLFYYRDERRLAFASEIKAFFGHPDIADRARSRGGAVLLHLRLRAAAGDVLQARLAARARHADDASTPTDGPIDAPLLAAAVSGARADGAADRARRGCGRRPRTADARRRAAADQRRAARRVPQRRPRLDDRRRPDEPADVASRSRRSASASRAMPAYDETAYARLAAERFETDHTEFRVSPSAIDLIDTLVWHHDGPFGDSSAIPTYLVSQLTRAARDGRADRRRRRRAVRRLPAVLRGAARRAHARLRRPGRAAALLSRAAGAAPTNGTGWRGRGGSAGAMDLPLHERLTRWNALFFDDLEALLRPDFVAGFAPIDKLRPSRPRARDAGRPFAAQPGCCTRTSRRTCPTICW